MYFWAHLSLCTVGSYMYASLSVCPSVCDWTKIHQTLIHISESVWLVSVQVVSVWVHMYLRWHVCSLQHRVSFFFWGGCTWIFFHFSPHPQMINGQPIIVHHPPMEDWWLSSIVDHSWFLSSVNPGIWNKFGSELFSIEIDVYKNNHRSFL